MSLPMPLPRLPSRLLLAEPGDPYYHFGANAAAASIPVIQHSNVGGSREYAWNHTREEHRQFTVHCVSATEVIGNPINHGQQPSAAYPVLRIGSTRRGHVGKP